jgi:hypothetical protein
MDLLHSLNTCRVLSKKIRTELERKLRVLQAKQTHVKLLAENVSAFATHQSRANDILKLSAKRKRNLDKSPRGNHS